KLVGYSMIIKNTPAEYKEKLQDVPILSENSYPSKEVLLEADPEIIIGSERSFNENGVGTIEELNDLGLMLMLLNRRSRRLLKIWSIRKLKKFRKYLVWKIVEMHSLKTCKMKLTK